MFFTLSGFIMAEIISRGTSVPLPKAREAAAFMYARCARIFPVYWMFSGLVVIAFLMSSRFNLGAFSGEFWPDFNRVILSLLLIPQDKAPILGPGWTLIYEMAFYSLVSISILIGMKSRLPWYMGLIAALSVVMTSLDWKFFHGHVFSHYFILFFAGTVLQAYANRLVALPRSLLIAVLASSMVGMGFYFSSSLSHGEMAGVFRCCLSGIMSITAIGLFMKCEGAWKAHFPRVTQVLYVLGESSYTIYLCHWFTLSALGKLAGFWLSAPVWVIALWHVSSIVLAIAIGTALSRWIELPSYHFISQRNPFRMAQRHAR